MPHVSNHKEGQCFYHIHQYFILVVCICKIFKLDILHLYDENWNYRLILMKPPDRLYFSERCLYYSQNVFCELCYSSQSVFNQAKRFNNKIWGVVNLSLYVSGSDNNQDKMVIILRMVIPLLPCFCCFSVYFLIENSIIFVLQATASIVCVSAVVAASALSPRAAPMASLSLMESTSSSSNAAFAVLLR